MRLQEYGLNPETVMTSLRKHHAYIAGSFPLQVLLDEYYTETDIDIFCLKSVADKLARDIIPSSYARHPMSTSNILNYISPSRMMLNEVRSYQRDYEGGA